VRTTIDAAGRLVVAKPLREQLGFTPGTEVDVEVVDAHLEVAIPSRVRVEAGPYGVRFTPDMSDRLSAAHVRDLIEEGRR